MITVPLAASHSRSAATARSSGALREARAAGGSSIPAAPRASDARVSSPPAAASSASAAGAVSPGVRASVARAGSRSIAREHKAGRGGRDRGTALNAANGSALRDLRASLGVADDVAYVNGVRGAEDERVAHTVVDPEDQSRAGALLRELHERRERAADAGSHRGDAAATAIEVAHGTAGRVDREHVAGR